VAKYIHQEAGTTAIYGSHRCPIIYISLNFILLTGFSPVLSITGLLKYPMLVSGKQVILFAATESVVARMHEVGRRIVGLALKIVEIVRHLPAVMEFARWVKDGLLRLVNIPSILGI